MIDWAARIEALTDVLRRQHALNDRLAIEAMLSALIDCPRTPASWLLLETPWYGHDCENGWFSFGKSWTPVSMKHMRRYLPSQKKVEQVRQWVEDNENSSRLFIEPDYRIYPPFSRHLDNVLQRCLRIRTRPARTNAPLMEVDEREQERCRAELATYTSAILRDPTGSRPKEPPRFIEPPEFLYYFELLQRLAPFYQDWRLLIRSFAALAIRHAHLHSRTETGPAENVLLARVVSDSVPPWVASTLMVLIEGPVNTLGIEKAMQLGNKYHRTFYGPQAEMERLRKGGIVEFSRPLWHIHSRHREGVKILLEGRAFGALASCA